MFRTVVMTTDQFNCSVGAVQVYALEGVGKGAADGVFAGTEGDPRVIFDGDFNTLVEARAQAKQLLDEAEALGYVPWSIWDDIEVQEA
jgi:hypothetical protein